MSSRVRSRLYLAVTLLILVPVATAFAHGEPVITVEPSVAAAGSSITISGVGMEPGEVFDLFLENASVSVDLGKATAEGEGEEGGFVVVLALPSDLQPGSYILRASTEEGESAVTDLTITSPSEEAKAGPVTVPEPSNEPHVLDRRKPTSQVVGGLALALSSAVVGIWLLRRP